MNRRTLLARAAALAAATIAAPLLLKASAPAGTAYVMGWDPAGEFETLWYSIEWPLTVVWDETAVARLTGIA